MSEWKEALGCVIFATEDGKSGRISLIVEQRRGDSQTFEVIEVIEKGIDFQQSDLDDPALDELAAGNFVELGFDGTGIQGIKPLPDEATDAETETKARRVPKRLMRFGQRNERFGEDVNQCYLHPDVEDKSGAWCNRVTPRPDTEPETHTCDDRPLFVPDAPFSNSNFRYRPRLDLLMPGDLVLFEAWDVEQSKKNLTQWVQMAQHYGEHRGDKIGDWVHARWNHAGVYLGDVACERPGEQGQFPNNDRLCEANFATKEVKITELWRYNEFDRDSKSGQLKKNQKGEYLKKTNRLRVRRPKISDEKIRRKIAEEACKLIGAAYDMWVIRRQGARSIFNLIGDALVHPIEALKFAANLKGPSGELLITDRRFTCAAVYAEAFRRATGTHLEGCENLGTITPSKLSASDEFEDIPMQWEPAP
ncbi:MAG: hypothetical protein ACT4PZ_24615 [Panacagrimonas sp.]